MTDEPIRGTNDLGTPAWFLALVYRIAAVVFDPCSNPWSNVVAAFTASAHAGEDGLSISWFDVVQALGPGLVYVNPPYGHGPVDPATGKKGPPLLPAWAAKIVEEAARGVEIIVLVPLAPDTAWWRTLRDACQAKCDIEKRIGFEGGAHGTGQIRNTAFYFGPRPRQYLFCYVFDEVGEVRAYDARRKTT